MHLVAPRGLTAKPVRLPYPSVGATEQTLLTAVMAKGITELSNAATEPEIMDLIAVLQKMGAIISVDTDRTIRIEGVDKLTGYAHTALPDRIEAGSWASAALATHGDIFVHGAEQQAMMSFLAIAWRPGMMSSSGCLSSSMVFTSARVNQRALVSSLVSTSTRSCRAIARQPIIKECGNGQGWLS